MAHMKEKEGRIYHAKGVKAAYIYVSADVVKDSQFPFRLPTRVNVRIDGNRLIIEQVKKDA